MQYEENKTPGIISIVMAGLVPAMTDDEFVWQTKKAPVETGARLMKTRRGKLTCRCAA
jgi:hypothetical protein